MPPERQIDIDESLRGCWDRYVQKVREIDWSDSRQVSAAFDELLVETREIMAAAGCPVVCHDDSKTRDSRGVA